MTIQIEYETERKLEIPYEKLAEKIASHILELEKCPYEISVNRVITDNEEIRKVNAEFRLIDSPTDVLLGDVMISVDRVYSQAQEYGHSIEREFSFLFAHSMLHLLGYDHMTPEEAAVMEQKQAKALDDLGITR